jgi:integrase
MAVYRPKYRNPKTGELLESQVWWYEFIYSGKRVRASAKTSKKTIAGEAEKDHRRRLERAAAGLPTVAPGRRISSVLEVLEAYGAQYGVNHRDNSLTIVKNRARHLVRVLGTMLLPDLVPVRLTEYMEQRRAENASNRTINMELMVLSRAVGYTWKALWPKLKKLQENQDVGRALEPEEEKRVLAAAAANPSKLIYPFLMTLTWTGIRSDEARTLRWSQVDFEAPQIRVGKSKTEAGARRAIPMGAALKMTLEQHAAFCAGKLGPLQPEWYVFPLSNRTRPVDATRPVTSLKTAWATVKTDAGVTCRLHDLRHSFCTKLAEAGVPESTMLDMMGHVSASMLRRYSHIRATARREAIAALEGRVSLGVPQESPKVSDLTETNKTTSVLVS